MNKALFLDRDGIINVEKNYLYRIEDFEFIDETLMLMKEAQKKGYLIIIVSNQAGIAKGKFTENDFHLLDHWMISQLKNRGIMVMESFYCPYHKDGIVSKYKKDSYDRKPNPGMLIRAIEKYQIDPQESYMIGDRFSDIIAGYNASVKNLVLLEREYSYRDYRIEDFPNIKFSIVLEITSGIIK